VDKARSREFGGIGIGLAIAQWIVQQHHGSIDVQSSLGNGSRFNVRIPVNYDCEALGRVEKSVA
jgi:two-component system, OmpR family, sensor histidine kinase CiaH